MNYEVATALFRAGSLIEARILPSVLRPGFELWLVTGSQEGSPLEVTRSGQTKVYKTLDAAARDAQRIGFRSVHLELVQ